jgi:uncharacterized BrkB/YihY/UPF0761 family membrane protein
MKAWDPKSVWDELRKTLKSWIDDAAPSMGAALAFYTVLSLAPLLLFSLVASTFLASAGTLWFGKSELVIHAIEFFTSFVVITLLFALIYKLLPSKRIAWDDVDPSPARAASPLPPRRQSCLATSGP